MNMMVMLMKMVMTIMKMMDVGDITHNCDER